MIIPQSDVCRASRGKDVLDRKRVMGLRMDSFGFPPDTRCLMLERFHLLATMFFFAELGIIAQSDPRMLNCYIV